MDLRFSGVHSIPSALQNIPIFSAWALFFYLWSLLFLRARNSYSKDTATLSVKECSFVVYSMTVFAASLSGSVFWLQMAMTVGTGRILRSNPQSNYHYYYRF